MTYVGAAKANHAPLVDMRSDTVTQPTKAMRAAMLSAPVGDDVYGDDPTVNELQDRTARLLGKEVSAFYGEWHTVQSGCNVNALPAWGGNFMRR